VNDARPGFFIWKYGWSASQASGCPVYAKDLFLGCIGDQSLTDLCFEPCTNLVPSIAALGEWCTNATLESTKNIETVKLQNKKSINLITTKSYAIPLGQSNNVFDSVIKTKLVFSDGTPTGGYGYIFEDQKYSQADTAAIIDYTRDVAPLIKKRELLEKKLNIKAPDILILLIVTNQRISSNTVDRIKNERGILLSYGDQQSLEWTVSQSSACLLSHARPLDKKVDI